MEAIAYQNLHIWHMFFGLPGSINNLNVLDQSPLIIDMLIEVAANVSFQVNGRVYPHYYLLADAIYSPWSCFVQSIHQHGDKKRAHFAKRQEVCRKDVEHCFGVLQA